MMKWLVPLLIALVALAGCAQQPQIIVDSEGSSAALHTVSVSGQAKADVEPDLVQIRIDVISKKDTAEAAQEENAKKLNEVFAALDELDIDEDERETVNVRLYPNREWNNLEREYDIDGYIAAQSILIASKKIDQTGEILDTIVKAGVNDIDSVSFTLSEPVQKEIKERLMKEAVENAAKKADILAQAANRKRGQATIINEGSSVTPRPVYREALAVSVASMDASTPVEAGDVAVSLNVGVVYQLE